MEIRAQSRAIVCIYDYLLNECAPRPVEVSLPKLEGKHLDFRRCKRGVNLTTVCFTSAADEVSLGQDSFPSLGIVVAVKIIVKR